MPISAPPDTQPDFLDRLFEAHGTSRSSLIPLLHAAQHHYGHLSPQIQDRIARHLDVPSSTVYGVVTFYSFFKTEPSGRHTANVCLGTACYVKGSDRLLKDLEEQLGIKVGETTADGRLTLGTCRCIGLCDQAPAMIVDEEHVHGPLETKTAAIDLLEGLD
ncbi:MAG TPA: NAD(P)H-dependent oxidoreductase subunit E [Stenomitos sp.]